MKNAKKRKNHYKKVWMGWIIMKFLHLQYFKKVFETKNVTQSDK
ncbi:LysR family transcriptional regulator, partial [Enterococcus faecium]